MHNCPHTRGIDSCMMSILMSIKTSLLLTTVAQAWAHEAWRPTSLRWASDSVSPWRYDPPLLLHPESPRLPSLRNQLATHTDRTGIPPGVARRVPGDELREELSPRVREFPQAFPGPDIGRVNLALMTIFSDSSTTRIREMARPRGQASYHGATFQLRLRHHGGFPRPFLIRRAIPNDSHRAGQSSSVGIPLFLAVRSLQRAS